MVVELLCVDNYIIATRRHSLCRLIVCVCVCVCRYRDEDEDDQLMESSFAQQQYEEIRR